MNRRTLNLLLFVALLLVVTATFLVRAVPTERNVEVLPGMFYSIPGDPQTDLLPGAPGNAPLNAVPGTISRGASLFPSETNTADSALPLSLLANPLTVENTTVATRGAKVFAVFCSPCHGTGGAGDGSVAKRGYPPPPSLTAQHAADMTDEQMFMIITQGFRNMPSYMSQIGETDRWAAVLHIRRLQSTSTNLTVSAAADSTTDTQPAAEAAQ